MSHVVVFNSSAKTVKIPTTPVKYLSEIRDEACQKFHLSKDHYTLKYNNKPIALSQQIRLAGLAQGARLELVQASRSPTVISVALQLPVTENNVRLTNKFASNTSLWAILRQFESGEGGNYNFTQRGVPELNENGKSGAGRLNYESPVITVMPGHKEYSHLSDLQKTLTQLGFDSGSALLRLNYKNSGKPLEEAMTEITQYFKSSESPPSGAHAASAAQENTVPDPAKAAPEALETVAGESVKQSETKNTHEPMEVDPPPVSGQNGSNPSDADKTVEISCAETSAPTVLQVTASSEPPAPDASVKKRVYAAPDSATPRAALQPYNEADYIPSIDHAKSHQASLTTRGRNTRLPSDKELEEQENARLEKLNAAAEKGSVVHVRLPNVERVSINVDKSSTAEYLYKEVEEVIQFKDEFHLHHRADNGQQVIIARDNKRLILDWNFRKSELVTFTWSDKASSAARTSRSVLKAEWQAQAKPLPVVDPVVEPKPEPVQTPTKAEGKRKAGSGGDKESKLKNLLSKHMFKK